MYCIRCGKESKNLVGRCEYCGHRLVDHELDKEETRTLNKALHTRENNSREKVDNAMTFIVLGSTLLIIGILFFALAFKYPTASSPTKQLSFTCFEFYVSLAGLIGGGTLLVIGVVRLIIEKLIIQKEIRRALSAVQTGKYVHLSAHSLDQGRR